MVYTNKSGILYIVSTPIGNLRDITLRALDVLAKVDVIACEDTRRTKILLTAYQIHKPLVSYFSYNKIQRQESIIEQLRQGKNIALVSDAGTPGISDPGTVLIRGALEQGIAVEVIPGASALLTGLIASGKPTHSFVYAGFLPVKSGARDNELKKLKELNRTLVLYESPHRLLKTLQAIEAVFGNCAIVVARELTKKFEEVLRADVRAVIEHFTQTAPKGEFVLVL